MNPGKNLMNHWKCYYYQTVIFIIYVNLYFYGHN